MQDDKSEILFLTSPTLGTGTVGSQSIVRPDWDGLAALAQALKDDTVPEYAASRTTQSRRRPRRFPMRRRSLKR